MKIKRLNFGCGNDVRKGWDNVDMQKGKGIKQSFDFNIYPYSIKENSYDYILVRQVLQVLNEPDKCLDELWRIAKKNAEIAIETPYYNNKGAYNDIKTKYYFNEKAFKFYVKHPCDIIKRKKYEIIELYKEPTIFGKFLHFEWLRSKLDLFISGVYSKIKVKLKVIK